MFRITLGRFSAATLAALLAGCATPPPSPPASSLSKTPMTPLAKDKDAAASCAALKANIPAAAIGLPNGGASIDSATLEAEVPLAVAERGPTPAARITPSLPSYCKVIGRIAPVDPKAPPIMFQVNLPLNWNGRTLQYGGGGFNGVLITGLGLPPAHRFDHAAPLAQGFITVGTDSGHQTKPGEAPQTFAANDEAFENFAHASYIKVRDAGVALAQRAFGRRPNKFYFMGSSEGGREGLTMAQRYPADFDGIFARVPVINWVGLQHGSARSGLTTMGDAYMDKARVQLVHDAVLATCDAADGLKDGLVANPVACKQAFDVTKLRCSDGKAGNACLSDAQIKAVQSLHAPVKFPFALANGITEYPGWGVSGEATPAFGPTGGWGAWYTGNSPPTWPPKPDNSIAWIYGSGGMAHIFARDPNIDISTYKVENFADRARAVSALMDSTNPNLAAFNARGGKLVMLEYMADYAQSPYAGIQYFESVVKRMGKPNVDGFMKLYVAPGVDHVGSGAPANVDMLSVLVDWVENGKAPGKLEVLEQELKAPAFAPTRALPLCEWPLWPKYKGGDGKVATSFECSP